MQRYEYLKAIAQDTEDGLVVVTGTALREWQTLRPGDGNFRTRTLGLASSIGLGIALGLPHRKVIVIDGDGAFLMNLCGLPTIAWHSATKRQAAPRLRLLLLQTPSRWLKAPAIRMHFG